MEDDWLNIKVNNEFPIILEPYEKISFNFEMDIVTTKLDNVMYMTPHITLVDGRSMRLHKSMVIII